MHSYWHEISLNSSVPEISDVSELSNEEQADKKENTYTTSYDISEYKLTFNIHQSITSKQYTHEVLRTFVINHTLTHIKKVSV